MKAQNYQNHTRFYYPHHFIFYPLILLLIGFSFFHYFMEDKLEFLFIGVTLILITWLSFMLRQHYALGNQNRIVRLELRLRYFQLTGKGFELLEQQLSFAQLAALRFASDTELIELIHKTIAENLSPNEIKKSIKVWMPDYMRV